MNYYYYSSEAVCSYRLTVTGHCTSQPISETRLLSNLRLTTREFVYLARSGDFGHMTKMAATSFDLQ